MLDNVENVKESLDIKTLTTELFSEGEEPQKGDHLFVLRAGYTHHGIYIGNGK